MDKSESSGWWVMTWCLRPSWCIARLADTKLTWSERHEGDVCNTGWSFETEAEARAAYDALPTASLANHHRWFELRNDGAIVEERENPEYSSAESEREERAYRELCRAEARVLYGPEF